MICKSISLLALVALAGCSTGQRTVSGPSDPLAAFQQRAAKYDSVVTLPVFETSPEAVETTVNRTIADGNAALDGIGRLQPNEVNFGNTIRSLDDSAYLVGQASDRLGLIEQTSTNAAVRDAATDAIKKLSEWSVGTDYREDVYAAVKAFAATQPALTGEDKKLFDETLRDYRRAGLNLPKDQRDEVEKLRKELTAMETDYENNVTKATQDVEVHQGRTGWRAGGFSCRRKASRPATIEYTLKANITFHYLMVEDNAKREDTRRRMMTDAIQSRARGKHSAAAKNSRPRGTTLPTSSVTPVGPIMQRKCEWSRTPRRRSILSRNSKPVCSRSLTRSWRNSAQMKIKETGDPNATIHIWDWRYFSNQLKKRNTTWTPSSCAFISRWIACSTACSRFTSAFSA